MEDFARLVESVELGPDQQPLIVNRPTTDEANWPLPAVREMILVPLSEGTHSLGWLAAFNHDEGGQFGTVEASLLSSVAAILGIHGGNIELYEQQRETFSPAWCGPCPRSTRKTLTPAATAIAWPESPCAWPKKLGCDRKKIETDLFRRLAARRRQNWHRRQRAAKAGQTYRR